MLQNFLKPGFSGVLSGRLSLTIIKARALVHSLSLRPPTETVTILKLISSYFCGHKWKMIQLNNYKRKSSCCWDSSPMFAPAGRHRRTPWNASPEAEATQTKTQPLKTFYYNWPWHSQLASAVRMHLQRAHRRSQSGANQLWHESKILTSKSASESGLSSDPDLLPSLSRSNRFQKKALRR